MEECRLCGKNGEDISLFSANHKEFGSIMVCDKCWRELYEKNRMICGATGGSGSCPTCGT